MPKIPLDSEHCFHYYAELVTSKMHMIWISVREIGGGQVRSYVYSHQTGLRYKDTTTEDQRGKEAVALMMKVAKETGILKHFEEEELDHDNFKQSLAWMLKKPRVLELLQDE